MRLSDIRIGFYGIVLSLFLPVGLKSAQITYDKTLMSEVAIRAFAVTTVMPEYPVGAVHAHQTGVAVASIAIDKDGRPSEVIVLQAPSDSIKAAVAKALVHWRFAPAYIGGVPVKVEGKLTFYFVIQRGKGTVLNPDSAGYQHGQHRVPKTKTGSCLVLLPENYGL